MSDEQYRLRQEYFSHFLWLVVMPAGVHLFFGLIVGAEAESSLFMLICALFSALAIGAFLAKGGYGAVVSSLAAAWPIMPASAGHWHWAIGMCSPGPSAQALVRAVGWPDASMTAALGVLMVLAGGAGWVFILFDRWFKRKTGRSLFEES